MVRVCMQVVITYISLRDAHDPSVLCVWFVSFFFSVLIRLSMNWLLPPILGDPVATSQPQ